jgi:Tfp pilus assembly protein PilO
MAASLTESRKTMIIIVISVVAMIIGLAMIFLQVNNLNTLRASVEDEKLALTQAEALLNQRLEYQANAPLYREKAARLKQMIPDQPQEEEILRLINLMVEEYDLRIHEIRFDTMVPDAENGYVRMPLTITIEGSYSSLIDLLDHLQWSGRAFRVDQISIALAGNPQGEIRTVILASAFFTLTASDNVEAESLEE